jgi:hypothetical protein
MNVVLAVWISALVAPMAAGVVTVFLLPREDL